MRNLFSVKLNCRMQCAVTFEDKRVVIDFILDHYWCFRIMLGTGTTTVIVQANSLLVRAIAKFCMQFP